MTTGGTEHGRATGDPRPAAIGNWVWLAGLTRNESALYAGDPHHALPGILDLQFGHVTRIAAHADRSGDAFAALDDATFDFVALPDVFGWWRGSSEQLVQMSRRLLRRGGWLVISGDRAAPMRPRRLAEALGHGGFGETRGFYVDGAVAVPWDRRAVKARETMRSHYHADALRRVMVTAGLHRLLYRQWMILAGA